MRMMNPRVRTCIRSFVAMCLLALLGFLIWLTQTDIAPTSRVGFGFIATFVIFSLIISFFATLRDDATVHHTHHAHHAHHAETELGEEPNAAACERTPWAIRRKSTPSTSSSHPDVRCPICASGLLDGERAVRLWIRPKGSSHEHVTVRLCADSLSKCVRCGGMMHTGCIEDMVMRCWVIDRCPLCRQQAGVLPSE